MFKMQIPYLNAAKKQVGINKYWNEPLNNEKTCFETSFLTFYTKRAWSENDFLSSKCLFFTSKK